MPYSDGAFDDLVRSLLKQEDIKRVLDVGCGDGKYGKILKQIHTNTSIIGVEIEADYIERFSLKDIYDDVWCMPADNLIEKTVNDVWDFILISHCIEHMRKSQGIDLLNFLVYRTKYLMVIYPEKYLQNTWHGYQHEAHISFWCDADFAGLDYVSTRRGNENTGHSVALAINGYLLRPELELTTQEILAGSSAAD